MKALFFIICIYLQLLVTVILAFLIEGGKLLKFK